MSLRVTPIEHWLEDALPRVRQNRPLTYSVALGVFVAALGLRLLLADSLPPGFPFLTFYPAVLLASIIGGAGPGILVLGASVLAATLVLAPADMTPGQQTEAHVALAVFVALCALMIFVAHLLSRTIDRLTAERRRVEDHLHASAIAELQLEQLNAELRHRNKNVFAMLSSLITQSVRHSTDVELLADELRGRLSAMASAQDLLINTHLQGADLKRLVEAVLRPIIPTGLYRIAIAGPPFYLPTETATPIALVLHELGTNSVKYGAWSNDRGKVHVRWSIVDVDPDKVEIVLDWTEEGGPNVRSPGRRGLGTVLIEKGIPNAVVERTFASDGLSCRIRLSVHDVTTHRTGVRQRA